MAYESVTAGEATTPTYDLRLKSERGNMYSSYPREEGIIVERRKRRPNGVPAPKYRINLRVKEFGRK